MRTEISIFMLGFPDDLSPIFFVKGDIRQIQHEALRDIDDFGAFVFVLSLGFLTGVGIVPGVDMAMEQIFGFV